MPAPLTLDQIGQEDTETREAIRLLAQSTITIIRDEVSASKSRLVEATIRDRWNAEKRIELMLDSVGIIQRGKCKCSHHFKNALRMGPCRHLQAVRNQIVNSGKAMSMDQWFRNFWN